MDIAFSSYESSCEIASSSFDQLLMAISANCSIYKNGDEGDRAEMPEMACLWFVDELVRSCKEVWNGKKEVAFNDFYGEYNVVVSPSGEDVANVEINFADQHVDGTLSRQNLQKIGERMLADLKTSFPEIGSNPAFRKYESTLQA